MAEIKGEVDHCRHRLMKYCQGQGLDLGCGPSKIKPDAIGVDLYHPEADMNMDARLLTPYGNEQFDYIFSSHLLEELQDTEGVLREWIRVLKKGGNLVLYQINEQEYYPIGDPLCNSRHKHHYTWEELWTLAQNVGDVELVHHADPVGKEWSFELVIQKKGVLEITSPEGEGISLLIPTFNRPQGMEQFALLVDKTTKCPEMVEIVFGIHEDDPDSQRKAIELKNKCKISIRFENINRYPDGKINLSFLWNQIYVKAKYPILGYFGDDVLFQTTAWDEEVRKEFIKDKAVMVCCNDVHIQRGKQATLFFTHRIVHEKFGLYLDERFRRWYMDTYWDQVYRNAGKIRYREDIITEHLHPTHFPDRADQVYKNMEFFKEADAALWNTPVIHEEIMDKSKTLKELAI